MDLGLHLTLTDSTSMLDPEVLAVAERINPTLSADFGKVWELFGDIAEPILTDTYDVFQRQVTALEVSVTASGGGADWDTNNDITGLPVSAGTIGRITVGDVLLVESEIVVVKSVDRSGNTIDVYERGAGESDPAAHGVGALTAKIVGNAIVEGKVDGEAVAEGTDKFTNYTQLVEEIIEITLDDQNQQRKIGATEPRLKGEAMERAMRKMARAAIFGVARVPTSAIPGMSRGLLRSLALSGGLVTNVSGAFTETVLQTALDTVRNAGGFVNAIVMGVSKKKTFNGFTGADTITQDVNEQTAGRLIKAYLYDGFGAIPAVVDLDMPSDQIALVDSRRLGKGWKVGDTLRFAAEPSNSRVKKETLQGKFGFKVENIGQSHHLLTNLT